MVSHHSCHSATAVFPLSIVFLFWFILFKALYKYHSPYEPISYPQAVKMFPFVHWEDHFPMSLCATVQQCGTFVPVNLAKLELCFQEFLPCIFPS